jgi:uncharacterized caspase-like protein
MRRVALLVGNSVFAQDPGIASLRFPTADVTALESILLTPEIGRFDRVQTLINASRHDVLVSLNKLLDEERGATVFFYYSGHGRISDGGSLFLATNDTTDRLLPATGVPFASILDMKDEVGCRQFCVVLDCCYAGLGSVNVKGSQEDRLKAIAGGKGVFFLGAANATSVAREDPALGHGVLTAGIIEGLKSGLADVDRDGRITGSDLFAWCRDFANRHQTHRPVQVSRLIDDDLVIAFSSRVSVPNVEQDERAPDLPLNVEQDERAPDLPLNSGTSASEPPGWVGPVGALVLPGLGVIANLPPSFKQSIDGFGLVLLLVLIVAIAFGVGVAKLRRRTGSIAGAVFSCVPAIMVLTFAFVAVSRWNVGPGLTPSTPVFEHIVQAAVISIMYAVGACSALELFGWLKKRAKV